MTDTIVLYHGGCRDGFCAAWVVNKYLTQDASRLNRNIAGINPVEYIPAYYGKESPDVTGKNVIIVDFCYPLEVMRDIYTNCKSLIWLDHHKTAESVAIWFNAANDHNRGKFIFDNNRSGAGLAWDYFFPNEPRPWLVDYVEDRDLWSNRLHFSKEVNALVACLEFSFSEWDRWSNETVGFAKNNGYIALLKTEQYVREVCKNVYFADIARVGFDWDKDSSDTQYYRNIPIVNICQVDCSEVLHELCELYGDSPFSLYWFKRQDGLYQYGLRSIGDFDCSIVAKLFGGGGHKNAAGFQLPYLLEELK